MATDFGAIHTGGISIPKSLNASHFTSRGRAYPLDMESVRPTNQQDCAQPILDVLIAALRNPAHAAPILAPIADELERA